MATRFDEINIGPFVGGLNSLSDQSSISDTELFQCVNFELDQDGSLKSRPPIRKPSANMLPFLPSGYTAYRTNLCYNPICFVDTTGYGVWAGVGGGASGAKYGNAYRETWTTAPTTGGGIYFGLVDVLPGHTYTARASVRCSIAQSIVLQYQFYATSLSDPTTSASSSTATTLTPNTYSSVAATFTVPIGSTKVQLRYYATAAGSVPFTVGSTLDLTSHIIEESPYAWSYFDGGFLFNSDGTNLHVAAWTGALGASTSTISYGEPTAVKLLGYFINSDQAVYLIASDRKANTYYYANGSWTLITSTFSATACCQFKDKLYLLAPLTSTNPGGTWTPAGGFVADTAMPKGAAIVSNKERLWVAQGKNASSNGSRVYLTDIVSGAPVWQGNFITASGGDGQNVTDLAVYNADIIIFKQSSTYRFAFGSDPASGYFTTISTTLGLNETGCWVANEQQLYVVSNNNVYEFTNYIFNRINMTVPLKTDNPGASLTETMSISAWADRLFVSYYSSLYVYNLKNRTWSTWQSDKVGPFGQLLPVPFQQAARPIAYLASTQPPYASVTAGTIATPPTSVAGISSYVYQIVNVLEAGIVGDEAVSESFQCLFETKNYDYQSPSRFKRLKAWGADVDLRNNITVYAQPVVYAISATWNSLATRTWDQAAAFTWDRPISPDTVISDTVSVAGISGGKKFIKFLKSLRFRQISFKGVASCNGILDDSPVRVFRLTTFVKEKELVSKKVN